MTKQNGIESAKPVDDGLNSEHELIDDETLNEVGEQVLDKYRFFRKSR